MKRFFLLALAILAATQADGQGSAAACYLGASFTTCYKPVNHASMEGPASGTVSGYLSSTDWTAFNSGGAGGVPATRSISTTAPLTGGGNLSADRTLAITQAATAANGYLSSTDWNTFNTKVGTATAVNTTAPLAGGGDLSTTRTLSITQAATAANGYLSSTDWNTFNTKLTSPLTTSGDLLYENATPAPTRLAAGTSVQLLHSGTPPSWSAVSLTADVTGTLPIGNGGTGQGTKAAAFDALSPMTTVGDIIYGGTAGTGTRLGIGSATTVLHGGASAPAYAAVSLTADVTGVLPVGNMAGPAATATSGYLSSTDWNTFNNKVATTRTINTTAPITGGGDLSADRTIAVSAIAQSTSGVDTSAAQRLGTNTNDSANSGNIGQIISATKARASAVTLTNATSANVITTEGSGGGAFITLTAGDWDLSGYVGVTGTATSSTAQLFSYSTTSATDGDKDGFATGLSATMVINTADILLVLPTARVSVANAATVNYYLVADVNFSGGGNTAKAYGTIRARRVR